MKSILLILLLVVGLFGSSNEEIGTPYAEQGKGRTKGSVLDPNGKYFYTLVGETVTKWELDPIKKVSSFKVNLAKKTRKPRLSISSDSKKMILWDPRELILIDLQTNRQIKKLKTDYLSERFHDIFLRWGVMDGLIFKILYADYNIINGKSIRKTIYKEYDIKNLNVIRSIVLPKLYDVANGDNDGYTIVSMYIYANRVFVFPVETSHSHTRMSILDNKTLKNIYTDKDWDISRMKYISLDKKVIYSRMYSSTDGGYPMPTRIYLHNVVNLETLKSKKITSKEFKETKYLQHFKKNISLFKELTLVPMSAYGEDTDNNFSTPFVYTYLPIFYNNVKNEKLATFYQFEDDWILIAPNGDFEASKKIRKYLKMKTSSGKVVPINNTTFKKYNKQINLIKN